MTNRPRAACAWDHWLALPPGPWQLPYERRMEIRVGGLPCVETTLDEETAARVCRLIIRRRRLQLRPLDRLHARTTLSSREPGMGCAVSLGILATMVVAPVLLSMLIRSSASIPVTLAIPALAFLALLAAIRVIVELSRFSLGLREAMLNNTCPDCGYPLSDLKPIVKCPRTGRVIPFPPACPECGSRWPTIPAPLRIERRTAGAK